MITFADGISLAENDLAGRCYAMLDKSSDSLQPEVCYSGGCGKRWAKTASGTLATMNLSPALMGAVLELLTA